MPKLINDYIRPYLNEKCDLFVSECNLKNDQELVSLHTSFFKSHTPVRVEDPRHKAYRGSTSH